METERGELKEARNESSGGERSWRLQKNLLRRAGERQPPGGRTPNAGGAAITGWLESTSERGTTVVVVIRQEASKSRWQSEIDCVGCGAPMAAGRFLGRAEPMGTKHDREKGQSGLCCAHRHGRSIHFSKSACQCEKRQ
jgi:hypothetical protein